jgi:hypothetical protein
MEKIQQTLDWIDHRVENYLSLMTEVVSSYTKDQTRTRDAESLLRTALRTAFFLDFFSETEDATFLREANKYKALMYSQVSEQERQDLQTIEKRIMGLFDYEKQIWTRVMKGHKVSNYEIEQFWKMKSADSLFYGRVIKIFTQDKDFTIPLYAYTQILDGVLDLREYEKDLGGGLPNLLYMKLSQRMPLKRMPKLKKDALTKAVRLGIYSELEGFVEAKAREVSSFNFGDCLSLKRTIEQKRREFHAEFVFH